MNRRRLLLATALLLPVAGCGAGGLDSHDGPVIVSTFPADGQSLVGWLDKVRVTYDEPVRVLNAKAVTVVGPDFSIGATAVPDPSDPKSILIVTEGGRWYAGGVHRVVIQEGAVVDADDHYTEDQLEVAFVMGAAPNLFVSSTDGKVYELLPTTGAQVSATTAPAGYLPRAILGADDEVFVWLEDTGAGDDELAYFIPGAGGTTTIALAGEAGTRLGLGLALSADGGILYATTFDTAIDRMLVHRVDVATRTEFGAPLVLSMDLTGSPLLAKRPAVDLARNHLYVGQNDGTGGGFLAVVDLSSFTEIDASPGPTLAVPNAVGAGDVTYGLERDRIWMTFADEPTAGFIVYAPGGYVPSAGIEPEFTLGPVSSMLTPDERFFVQGLEGYSDLEGVVRSETDEVDDGFASLIRDDVGGVLQGSDTVSAMVYDPASTVILAFATGTGSTVLVALEVVFANVAQADLDLVTPDVQGIDLSTSAPGEVVSATFLRGVHGP